MQLTQPFKGVYFRGEHGENSTGSMFHSRLGSVSFGTEEVSKVYALEPNIRHEYPVKPRVYKVELTLSSMLDLGTDPFIDVSLLRHFLDEEQVGAVLENPDVCSAVMNTDNFATLTESMDGFIYELSDFVDLGGSVDDLYFEAYHLFDNQMFCDWFKQVGIDGVRHGGSGESALTMEVKCFDPSVSCRILDVVHLR